MLENAVRRDPFEVTLGVKAVCPRGGGGGGGVGAGFVVLRAGAADAVLMGRVVKRDAISAV